jgi:hypothetical protein
MNNNIINILKQSGFCFWENEEWKPEGEIIDWSSNYDDEIEQAIQTAAKICCDLIESNTAYSKIQIQKYFGIE